MTWGRERVGLIHPQAVVENCTIGEGTKVFQFASVRNTTLGKDCVVWPFVMLDGPRFGDRCIIASGVAMGPGFRFGNDCFIGPNVTICNDRWPAVGKEDFEPEELRKDFVTVWVGDNVAIGANAVVLPGSVIEDGALIAAGAVVDGNVPADHLYRRDGLKIPIRPSWRKNRMCEAVC